MRSIRIVLTATALLVSFAAVASGRLDSLMAVLDTATVQSHQVTLCHWIAWELKSSHMDSAQAYARRGLEIATESDDQNGRETCLNDLGVIDAMRGNYDKSVAFFSEALEVNRQLGDTSGMADQYNNIGLVYSYKADYAKALEYYLDALDMYKYVGEARNLANAYNNVGMLHEQRQDFEQALEYHTMALQIRDTLGIAEEKGFSLGNIGSIHQQQGDDSKALEYFLRAEHEFREANSITSLAQLYGLIGLIFKNQQEGEKAVEYFERGVALQQELGDQRGMAQNLVFLADYYLEHGNPERAVADGTRSYEVASAIGSKDLMNDAARLVAQAHAALGDYESAYAFHQLYTAVKDSILSEAKNKQIEELEARYQNEKMEQEVKLLTENSQLKDEKLARNRILMVVTGTGLAAVILFALFLFRANRKTQSALQMVRVTNREIVRQKEIIEEKNKDITDSILYAQRIQEALLMSESGLAALFAEYFVLFKPRDIVSGDFYWVHETRTNKAIWAVADCTGHGVPGAFMSLVGNSLLNEIVIENGLEDPATILDMTRSRLIAMQSDSAQKDGMDVALCCLDRSTNKLLFAGANNPLYLLRNGVLTIIKGDSQPVGSHLDAAAPFTQQEVDVQPGDLIYLFSDGFADQFGGDRGKKFKYTRFREVLIDHADRPLKEQQQILEQTLMNWQGIQEQVDDICVVGVQV